MSWMRSYRSNRHQQIKVQAQLSTLVQCTRGIPQGSVLGPILFLLYTMDISTVMLSDVSHQEFADATMLDYCRCKPAVVAKLLSDAVSRLAEWLGEIGRLLNEKKTKRMFISPRGAGPVTERVICRNTALASVTTVKSLGLHVDSHMSGTSHLMAMSRKLARRPAYCGGTETPLVSMNRWKVWAALRRPDGMRLNSKSLKGVVIAVFARSSSCIGIR